MVEILLSFGADVDLLNDEGDTSLFFATHANNQLAACVLINHGANVRQKNAQGKNFTLTLLGTYFWLSVNSFCIYFIRAETLIRLTKHT